MAPPTMNGRDDPERLKRQQWRAQLSRQGSRRVGNGASRTLIVFDRPRDIAGTALLTYFDTGGDQQWVYFPSIKRVKTDLVNDQDQLFRRAASSPTRT